MTDPRDPLSGERHGAADDRVGAAGDRVGVAGDRVGAVGDRVGAVGDRVGAVGDRVGAVGDRGGGLGHERALEHLIDGVARAQAPRRAPASLEARVFAQIASRPWWSKGFAHWPVLARAAFLVASFGFIKLTLVGVMWVIDFVRTSDVAGVDTLHRTSDAVSATVSLGSLVFKAIPPVWLYVGAGVGFMLYAVLLGLGTFAYRTLYVQ